VDGQSINDNENGIYKGAYVIDVTYEGLTVAYNMWFDVDFTNQESPAFMMIYEAPQFLKALLPMLDKQYYYLDMSDAAAQSGMDLSSANIFDASGILDALESIDPAGMTVEKEEEAYLVTVANDAVAALLQQYLSVAVLSAPALSGSDAEAAVAEVLEGLDLLSALDLLGGKDVSAAMSVDGDGYLSDFRTALEFTVDTDAISTAVSGEPSDGEGAFTLGIDINVQYTDYNAVDGIEIPALTEENSEDLMQTIAHAAGIPEIAVFVNGSRIAFDVPPQSVNDRTMVPMRAIFEALGAEVSYDDGLVTALAADGRVITHTIGEAVVYIDGNALEMDVASFETGGRTLVPVRFVAQALGAEVDWIEEAQTVIITQ
jgi:hypothetical protein